MAVLEITIKVPMEHVDADNFRKADYIDQIEMVTDYIRMQGWTRDWALEFHLNDSTTVSYTHLTLPTILLV